MTYLKDSFSPNEEKCGNLEEGTHCCSSSALVLCLLLSDPGLRRGQVSLGRHTRTGSSLGCRWAIAGGLLCEESGEWTEKESTAGRRGLALVSNSGEFLG